MQRPLVHFDRSEFSTAAPADLPYVEVPLREVRTGPSDLDLDLETEIEACRAEGRTEIIAVLVSLGLAKP